VRSFIILPGAITIISSRRRFYFALCSVVLQIITPPPDWGLCKSLLRSLGLFALIGGAMRVPKMTATLHALEKPSLPNASLTQNNSRIDSQIRFASRLCRSCFLARELFKSGCSVSAVCRVL
jgi:hypothetical protein